MSTTLKWSAVKPIMLKRTAECAVMQQTNGYRLDNIADTKVDTMCPLIVEKMSP